MCTIYQEAMGKFMLLRDRHRVPSMRTWPVRSSLHLRALATCAHTTNCPLPILLRLLQHFPTAA